MAVAQHKSGRTKSRGGSAGKVKQHVLKKGGVTIQDGKPARNRGGSFERAAKVAQAAAAETVEADAYALSPKAKALLRGREIAASDLKAAQGAFDLQQVTDLLKITRQAVDKKVKEGSLLAVPGPSGQRRYPAAQFGADGVAPGLKEVLRALPTESAWGRLNFLVNPHDYLNGRQPIEALHRGEVGRVIEAAKGLGEQGA